MSTMNAWHPKASPRALFAVIGSFALGLFVAALALLSAAPKRPSAKLPMPANRARGEVFGCQAFIVLIPASC